MWFLLFILFILLFSIGLIVRIYNQLVELKAHYENGFAQIDVQLRRRYDLIPNLVETVRGYLQHENSTLTAVIEARNAAHSLLRAAAKAPSDGHAITLLGQAESKLTQALAGLNVQLESYPELKANETIKQLFEELTSTENRVAFARQAFNDGVTSYNIYRKKLPAILFAASFGHPQDATLLQMDDPEEIAQAPKIKLTANP